jgi:hypothetical protein
MDREQIEKRLRQVKGVESVQANPRTGNVLIRFDSRIAADNLLRELHEARTLFAESECAAIPRSPLSASYSTAIQVGVRGILGHAVVDSIWFGAGFLGRSIGLPLAWLGPLHVVMDIAVWALAVRSGTRPPHSQVHQVGPRNPVTSLALRTHVEAASV